MEERSTAYLEALPECFRDRLLMLAWRLPLVFVNLLFAKLLIFVGFKTYTRN